MCKDNKTISEGVKKGIYIDAEFPINMELVRIILDLEGYIPDKDFIHVSSQYENQLTKLRYTKTTMELDESGKKAIGKSRHFHIEMPDRYVPLPKEELDESVIRNREDIKKIYGKFPKKSQ